MLHDTGCRISEALALTTVRIDFSGKAIAFETLKERRGGVYRAVPVPEGTLFGTLKWFMFSEAARGARAAPSGPSAMGLVTARPPWRRVQVVMDTAGIEGGLHKCSKGVAPRLRRARHQLWGATQPRGQDVAP